MRARIVGEFSPIPAVKTKASIPPSAAASMPALQTDPIGEIVERERGTRIGACLQVAHVVADAGEAFQAAFAIKQLLDLRGGHLFLWIR